MTLKEKGWKIPQLIFCLALGACLIITFTWQPTKALWEMLDTAFFKWINGSLIDNPTWQLFWGCANHRYADWVEDACILGFLVLFVTSLKKEERLQGTLQMLFLVLYSAIILYVVNRIIFRQNFIIYRDSPTLVVEGSFRLTEAISWMRLKIDSPKCFPADHATTAILFAAGYAFYAGKRFGIPAILYAMFLCIPRMIVGAHWLSDVIVGSGLIVLFSLSLAFCTPFHLLCIATLKSFFTFFRKFKKIKST
ncbi:MAG: phosphatase PAP2 family protein [Chlamydiota bacterium]